jgi:hypothetical protein
MLQTYDKGITLVFEMPTLDATNVSVNHIGVLKDIEISLWPCAYPYYHF